MKRILGVIFTALVFIGCSQPKQLAPLDGKYKFDGIEYVHIQHHQPTKFKYQSQQEVEKKYNEQILDRLKNANLLDQNSSNVLKIKITHRRQFVGEATFAKTDRVGGIFFRLSIEVLKNGEILRSYHTNDLMYDPGFFGNLKTIAGQNTDDSLENGAIKAAVEEILEVIQGF